ncbi:MAG TPA: bifunctional phosphopantothenoylcysteine decarboxylase/phosphopantothenate--cysteine ligase CoaBC [Patescibacteria group bacterium]|nr:bifunctional phosphopantothenoylcysteine decarboxylase/phosphopantothenate--cysteine ligase CoaBC [Patescibacteria group bacterium]
MKRHIVIGITGGIAAFKVIDLVGHLVKKNFDVDVIMTKSATFIADPHEFEKITGHNVFVDLFNASFLRETILTNRSVDHVQLGQKADLFVIVPGTANVIAKLAHGIADDFLTTAALAATCPILVCPSMNVFMWNNPATQNNVSRLHELGIHTFGPDEGMLACGYEGKGRLPEITSIEIEIDRWLTRRDLLKGKTVLVTAGGTVEPIDDVRVITNKSSGKMGVAIAESAMRCGASVILLRSETAVSSRLGLNEYLFDTAASLKQLLTQHLPKTDICVHAAAVSDFTVKHTIQGKSSSDKPLSLELEPQMKILDNIKTINPKLFLVAFKAEYNLRPNDLVTISQERLKQAHADMIVANDIGIEGQGFASDYNEVYVIDKGGRAVHIERSTKSDIADRIVELIASEI